MGIEQPPKYYDDIFATSQAYNDPAPGEPGHVRCFPTTEEVVARYGPYIDNLELLFLPDDRCYIFAGTKKETQ